MRKLLTGAAVALALGATSASASPFAISASSEGGEVSLKRTDGAMGVIGFFVSQLSMLVSGTSSNNSGSEYDSPPQYYSDEKCEAEKAAEEGSGDDESAKGVELTGPEPLYFGF